MKNIGRIERIVRAVVGIALLIGAYFLEGNWSAIGILGILPLATAILGICPFKFLLEPEPEAEAYLCRAESRNYPLCQPPSDNNRR